jgi:hypothetical protein
MSRQRLWSSGPAPLSPRRRPRRRCAPAVEALENLALTSCITLDFELDALGNPLAAGQVIDDEFAALGLAISTDDPNGLMIFDTANPTGGDTDLATTDRGNVLIISEDGDPTDPDDQAAGGTITFAWDDPVLVDSIGLLDIDEAGGEIRTYDPSGTLLATYSLVPQGDGSFQRIEIDDANVARLEVELAGSGAITDLSFCPQVRDDECRMTGGNNVRFVDAAGTAVSFTGGFQVRSPERGTSNLEFQLRDTVGGTLNVHAQGDLDFFACDEEEQTATGVADATVNGVGGYTLEFTFDDNGEPGRNDDVSLTLRDAAGAVVYQVEGVTLNRGGNIQFHAH